MGNQDFIRRVMLDEAVFSAGFSAADKASAIRAMVPLVLEGKGYSPDLVKRFTNLVLSREDLYSTWVGGVATPHSRAPVNDTHLGWFFCPEGIDFVAMDGDPVHILVCWLSPSSGVHLIICERVMHFFCDKGFLGYLMQSKNDDDMRLVVDEMITWSA